MGTHGCSVTELCKLATKYGTDKIHYTAFYSLLLASERYSIRRVLEIGIGTKSAMSHVPGYVPGASLKMWREYFPKANIFGIDKDPTVLFTEKRIKTACADQSQPGTYSHLIDGVSFDLIVDDGSHKAEHQATAAKALLPWCSGLYIIEDADIQGGLLEMLDAPFSYVQVKGSLTGHCVVLSA